MFWPCVKYKYICMFVFMLNTNQLVVKKNVLYFVFDTKFYMPLAVQFPALLYITVM